jgi:hypothetical protein
MPRLGILIGVCLWPRRSVSRPQTVQQNGSFFRELAGTGLLRAGLLFPAFAAQLDKPISYCIEQCSKQRCGTTTKRSPQRDLSPTQLRPRTCSHNTAASGHRRAAIRRYKPPDVRRIHSRNLARGPETKVPAALHSVSGALQTATFRTRIRIVPDRSPLRTLSLRLLELSVCIACDPKTSSLHKGGSSTPNVPEGDRQTVVEEDCKTLDERTCIAPG